MVNTNNVPQLILLLVTDQFRQDAFHPDVTPNLYNHLALDAHATTFSNAYVSTPICTPARAALLTGKSPWNHGMLGYGYTVNCPKYPTTLPGILNEMTGYQTFAVGKNHFGWNSKGDYVGQGYEHRQVYDALTNQPHPDEYMNYWDGLHPGVDPLSVTQCGNHGLTYNEWQSCPYGGANESEHPTPWTTRKALEYLEGFDFQNTTNKLFLKVSYHRPHSPYDPPKRLLDKRLNTKNHTVPKRIVDNTQWDQRYLNTTPMSNSDWHGDPGEAAARHSRAGYLASCEFVDEGIGKLFEWLKAHNNNNINNNNNLWDDTMILWTTDHGDMNGDHNLWRKGYAYEGSSHVNLIAKLPTENSDSDTSTTGSNAHISPSRNAEPAISGALVETRDIAVTFYDYLGILDEVKDQDPLIDGISLVPILQDGNKHKGHQVRDWLDLELSTQYRADIHWNALIGVYDNDNNSLPSKCGLWKYIFHVYLGIEQLFCLTNDRNEHHDLAVNSKYGNVLRYWQTTLVDLFERQGRGKEWVKNGKLVAGRKSITFASNYPCLSGQEEPDTKET